MHLTSALIWLAPLLVVGHAGKHGKPWKRQDEELDVGKKTRRRALGSLAVLGDYLYLEGGEHSSYENSEKPSTFRDSYPTNNTLAVSLTESWDNSTISFALTIKDKPRPVNKMALWADQTDNVLYRWGGEISQWANASRDDAALWRFTPGDDGEGQWAKEEGGDGFGDILQASNGAAAVCGQKSFYMGGYGTASSDYRLGEIKSGTGVPPLPGLLSYDMGDKVWSNISAVAAIPPNGISINGQALCPSTFNDDGILVFVGGLSTSRSDASRDIEMNSMRNITFFDPANETWHWQEARGEIPRPREHHCAVGAQGQNGTYEIFMYGGRNPDDGEFGDISILSLPAFEWFRVEAETAPRIFHACAVIGNRQMISAGGMEEAWDWVTPDPWYSGIGVFDMTELKWTDGYDAAAAAYDSPDVVKEWYANGGLSTVTWSTDKAKDVFGNDEGGSSGSGSGDDNGSNSGISPGNETSQDGSSPSSTPVGAIAGGVVGGVAAIALFAVAGWFWRKKAKARAGTAAEGGYKRAHESASELAGSRSPFSPTPSAYKPGYSVDASSPDPMELPTRDFQHTELPSQLNERPLVRHELQG